MTDIRILIPALAELIRLTPSAQRIFLFCLQHRPQVLPEDVAPLAAGLGYTPRSVQRALRQLSHTAILSRCVAYVPRQHIRLSPYSDYIKPPDQ